MKSGLKIIIIVLILVGIVSGSQAKIFSQSSTKHGPSLMGARIGYKIQVSGGSVTWQGAATTWQGGAVTW